MKKRIIAIVMMVVMVMCLSMTAFAANGVSSEENAVLEHFIQVLNKHKANIGPGNITQYIAEATNALNYADLNSAACKDLDNAVTAVDNYLTANVKSRNDARNKLPDVLNIVNTTSQKYGMTVSVDTNTGFATVTFGNTVIARTGGGVGIVNQTGVNTTITVVALAAVAFVVAGIASIVISRKNKVVAQ